MNVINMATRKRINITIHPIELRKLDKIAKRFKETRSGMIERLINSFNENSFDVDFADSLEDSSIAYHNIKKKGKVK